MKQEFIIVDASIKYMNAKNPLDERLLYCGADNWSRNLNLATRYATPDLAIAQARILRQEAPVKVFAIQINGNNINIGELQF